MLIGYTIMDHEDLYLSLYRIAEPLPGSEWNAASRYPTVMWNSRTRMVRPNDQEAGESTVFLASGELAAAVNALVGVERADRALLESLMRDCGFRPLAEAEALAGLVGDARLLCTRLGVTPLNTRKEVATKLRENENVTPGLFFAALELLERCKP